MAHRDLESLLAPFDDETPSGPDLEYDPEFQNLERTATPKAERAVGDSVKTAEEPDWDKVSDMGEALLGRSKDLRIALHLTAAWTRMHGLAGWTDGLALIRGLLENQWDSVHPQLDAEDDNDPTARVNAVVPLTDMQGVLGYFRSTPFVQSPRLGRYSLRDLRIANGTMKVSAENESALPSMTDIEACCLDCAEEQLTDAAQATAAAMEHARAIDAAFNDRIGTAGPDLKPLLGEIYELKKFLDGEMAKRAPAGEAGAADGDDAGDGSAAPAAANAAGGRIETPQDVIRKLDEICEYYARREPSSPVPHILRRAQRLVGMDFVGLMKDLAPGGLSEFQVISGANEE
ncbi:type VI secretion system protein TssA [Rhodanobacter sp. DHB23]|uniref:type VI secretion system protein TssA n=1 Tax=Rhodanobacter sp. DHB23 TaxID=2775923 RepID=UPI00177E3A74|nr:type VI secretion system protein TssA [Rhodanobacter sp. DHB23]MBD8872451.1 type VI secretion system protein TssA [Rhodanobacter sp. DHB23]